MSNKKQIFNSFFNPIKVDPKDCSEKYVSANELGYNEKGQVVIIEKPAYNLYEEIQSYKDDCLLSEQLKRIANGLQDPLQENYQDVSEINADTAIIDKSTIEKEVARQLEKAKQQGLDTDKILKANQEELKNYIDEYVKQKIETMTAKERKEDVK